MDFLRQQLDPFGVERAKLSWMMGTKFSKRCAFFGRPCGPAHEFIAGNAMMFACLSGIGASVARCTYAMLCSRRR